MTMPEISLTPDQNASLAARKAALEKAVDDALAAVPSTVGDCFDRDEIEHAIDTLIKRALLTAISIDKFKRVAAALADARVIFDDDRDF